LRLIIYRAIVMHSFVRGSDNFFKKHDTLLKTTALVLMLVIPFLLYAATTYDAIVQVKLLLVLMGADMLYVMLKG